MYSKLFYKKDDLAIVLANKLFEQDLIVSGREKAAVNSTDYSLYTIRKDIIINNFLEVLRRKNKVQMIRWAKRTMDENEDFHKKYRWSYRQLNYVPK